MIFPPGNSLHPFADSLRNLRAAITPVGMGEVPRDPLHGSDEAKLRALAADLVRRNGPDEASRLADIFVGAIQTESRK